ncbi:MAG TPA: STAS domain-containing protein [Solirubrobacterales bacterium]|nr:STAS domain-containing protein [Solirubrobacterales bacterium]
MPTTDFKVHDGLLTVQQMTDDAQTRVALQGEMDLSNHGIAETVLREALTTGREVVVDLGKLEFIDSTGLAMLVRAMAEAADDRLGFLPPEQRSVRRLLSLTGLEERMRFVSVTEVTPDAIGDESLLQAS